MIGKATRAIDIDLLQLVQGVAEGEVVLPNFQRDFDWTVPEVRALLGTVLRGWPLGSLLLIEGDKDREFYAPRPFENVPRLASTIDYIVLDGQQRLTALYNALFNVGEVVYAVKISRTQKFETVEDLDSALVAIKRSVWSAWESPRQQREAGFLPVYVLGDASAFFDWRDRSVSAMEADESHRITAIYREFLSGIHRFEIPAVVIGKSIGPEAVARIFERVNRTGVKLGAFDLMVAKSFSSSFNLRTAWEDACKEDERFVSFLKRDGLPLLSTLALRQRDDVRQSAVLDLTGAAISDSWAEVVFHFSRALDFCLSHLGLIEPDWLAYKAILPVLAALDFDMPLVDNSRLVERWYWATVVGRRYNEGANTTAVADFRALRLGDDPIVRPPVVVREFALEATRGQQGALHRSFLNALGKRVLASDDLTYVDRPIRTESIYSRGLVLPSGAPLHLRTFSHYIWAVEGRSSHLLDAELQFGDPEDFSDPEVLLTSRFSAFLRYIEGLIGGPVMVLAADDANVEEIAVGSDQDWDFPS